MKRSLVLLVALLVVPAASARADIVPIAAGTETTSSGSVTATVSWQAGESPIDTTLTITRDGVVAFNQPIPNVCDDACIRSASDGDEFMVADLDGDGEPEVLIKGDNLDHCCDDGVGIYHYDAARGTYVEFYNHFPSIELESKRGKVVIIAQDTRFNSVEKDRFKLLPLRAFAYEAGPKLVDVTKRYALGDVRELAGAHRDELLKPLVKDHDLNRAVAAEYVAEEYLLGHGAAGLKIFDRAAAAGHLGSAKTAAALRKRLVDAVHRFGYA